MNLVGSLTFASGFACTQYSGSNIIVQGNLTVGGTGTATGLKCSANSGYIGGSVKFPGTGVTSSNGGACV
jgi:hypothetical protein